MWRGPDELLLQLWQYGTLGVIEEADGWRAFFDEAVDRPTIAALGGDSYEKEADRTAPALEGYEPILVGKRFFVVPPWAREEKPAGRSIAFWRWIARRHSAQGGMRRRSSAWR